MICPASIVRYCGEFTSHPDSMYFHLLKEHTPEEVSLALMAFRRVDIQPPKITNDQLIGEADGEVRKLEEWFKGSIKEYKQQKVTGLRGFLEYCPECGNRYITQCKCILSDRCCSNRHWWHHHQQPHARGPLAYKGESDHGGKCGPETCEPIDITSTR